MSFRPSPFQTQTPTFASPSSPLDQIINGVQPGPSSLPHPSSSSRGALVERAFSLTRGAGPSGKSQRTQESMSAGGKPTSHALRGRPHPAAAAPASSPAVANRYAQQQDRRIATDYSEPPSDRQAPSGSFQRTQPDWQTANLNDSTSGWNEGHVTSGEPSSERQRVQRLREVRLSQQQQQLQQQQQQYQQQQQQQKQQQQYHHNQQQQIYHRQRSEAGARAPGSDQTFIHSAQREPSQGRPHPDQFGRNPDAGASSAPRSPIVPNNSSDASHSFVVYGRPDMSNGAPPLRNVHEPEQDYRDDVDRIAQEVRGLTMRRRQSVDTVRSSEFGEDGRWAKAWAGSDDGLDDEEEEEMDLQAMRARDMTDFDVEGKSTPQTHYVTGGLGALGELGSLQGLRAAMDHSPNRRQNQAQTAGLPPIQNVAGNVHTVSLTPLSSRASPSLRQAPNHSANNQQRLNTHVGAHTAQLNRRDTIMSVAGEIDEVSQDGDDDNRQAHVRRGSNATMASNTSSDTLGNAHVMVWPPTPSASVAGSSHGDEDLSTTNGSSRNHNRDTLRATPRTTETVVGQRALVEDYDEPKQVESRQATRPQVQHPISPSSLLAQQDYQPSSIYGFVGASGPSAGRPAVQDNPFSREMLAFNGFENPDQYNQSDAHDGLGKMRRKAIADHDGRESLVSDLDVITLRLDGSSVAGGSSFDERDPRRDSTSTIGTISSVELNEQRRRRSQLERRDAMLSGQDDRRSSTATLRSGDQNAPSPRYGYKQPDYAASQRISAPDSIGFEQVTRPPVPPKRSNTQPEDELQQQYLNRSVNQSGSAQSSPWMSRQQSAPGESTPAMPASSSVQSGATSRRMPASASSSMPASPTLRSGSSVAKNSSRSGLSNETRTTNPSGHANSAAAPMQSQAEKFLTLGISYHESGDLSRSAYHFERSAKVDGGCVVGMCMWGMALREGWGVRVDQKRGFEWISRAAARAGEMMSGNNDGTGSGRSEAELRAIRSELKLSVYELGKCFCYGWGVKMDKQMALEYFELAARLGDADAQAEAGALLAAGKGCKKDLKRAAMYYRMAEAQGYDTVGLSWIHKDKYDPTPMKTK